MVRAKAATARDDGDLSGARSDKDARLELLRFSYGQVLDATKHQDDKINRFLTTIAFLTAASLALGNLNAGRSLATSFHLGQAEWPLAEVSLGVFLVGVVATVIMLISSLTTPLRFPKQVQQTSGSNDPQTQFYFHSIAGLSLEQWKQSWNQGRADLDRDHELLLIQEIHNLALRTEYKYSRTNEAVAVLSLSLLAFSVATTLVLLGLESSLVHSTQRQVVVNGSANPLWVVGVLLFGYCALALMSSIRPVSQEVDELARWRVAFGKAQRDDLRARTKDSSNVSDERRTVAGPPHWLFRVSAPWSRGFFCVAVAAFPGILVAAPSMEGAWLWVEPALLVVAIFALLAIVRNTGPRSPEPGLPTTSHSGPLATTEPKGPKTHPEASALASLKIWGWLVVSVEVVIAVLVVGFDRLLGWETYLWQFSLAFLVPVTLMAAALIRIGVDQRWRVAKYLNATPSAGSGLSVELVDRSRPSRGASRSAPGSSGR